MKNEFHWNSDQMRTADDDNDDCDENGGDDDNEYCDENGGDDNDSGRRKFFVFCTLYEQNQLFA